MRVVVDQAGEVGLHLILDRVWRGTAHIGQRVNARGEQFTLNSQTHRGFCSECGSPIQGKPDAVPHIVAIRTASLDDPSWFNLQMDVWTSDAHPWDQMNPTLPKFEKYPSSGD
jgi:hypothetical protein